MKSKKTFILLVMLLSITGNAQDKFVSCGDPDIDAVRNSFENDSTRADNWQDRSILMLLWMGALQQQGADLSSFVDINTEYYRLEELINSGAGKDLAALVIQMGGLIDAGYAKLERIYQQFLINGQVFKPYESDGKDFPSGGNLDADWPMFQANKHNNGYTEAPGPKYGRTAWKFPFGLGSYSRPVIEDNRVYIASPGIRTTSFCLDLNSGKEIWKSTQQHPKFGMYKYPAIMSTPVIQDDKIILREVNSHGGNRGQAKNLVYIDKKTGKTLNRSYAGFVDYRTRYAPVASNSNFVIYPFGFSDIYSTPATCQNFNRLICRDKDNNELIWDFNAGDIDALAEPVMTEKMVYQGTMEGYLYALDLIKNNSIGRVREPDDPTDDFSLAWSFKAGGAINTSVVVHDGKIYFGSNDGTVYCLNGSTGEIQWSTKVKSVEKRARKHFTTGVIENGKLYMGSANKSLYAFDIHNGEILWQAPTKDWVRSNPVITNKGIYVVDVSGRLYQFDKKGTPIFERKVSTHPIYADLALSGNRIVLNDSDLMTYCLDLEGNEIRSC